MPPTQRALPAQARAARNARPSPTELGGGQSADGASARKRSLSLTRDGDARSDGTRVCSVRAVVDATLSELRGRQLRASKGREWQRPLLVAITFFLKQRPPAARRRLQFRYFGRVDCATTNDHS